MRDQHKKDHMFKWKHYQPDIILIAVNYYCRFFLSYRDVSEILKERGVSVVPPPTTIMRLVHERLIFLG